MVKCKKCNQVRYFHNLSELRTHQWRKHAEIFSGFKENLDKIHKRGWTKEQHKKYRASMKLRRAQKQVPTVELVHVPQPVSSSNGEMTVSTLLGKLREQKDFMTNVVSLIENLVKG